MTIQAWQPSTFYLPGAYVVPTTIPSASPTVIDNADFESGDVGWTKSTGWAINQNLAFYGSWSAEYSGPGAGELINSTAVSIVPGKAITASCFVHQGASDDDQANAAVCLRWYDADDQVLSTSAGNTVSTGAPGTWLKSTVSATAPANAAKVAIGVIAYNDWAALNVDGFAWNYVKGVAANALAFKVVSTEATGGTKYLGKFNSFTYTFTGLATENYDFIADGWQVGDVITISGAFSPISNGVHTIATVDTNQLSFVEPTGGSSTTEYDWVTFVKGDVGTPEGGMSGASEPTWPGSVGDTVLDNQITWQAVETDSVTWEASSVLTSGSQEPTWPTTVGAFAADNNIAWECIPLRITDENCPHTKVVAIAASKVFAGDTDIVRFCATLNARDWTSDDDAGFLPTGLQQKSQVGVDAMGVYRGNLAVWSGSTFQVWQVDPDPAAMALLDAMEGIGSIHQQAVQPVSDDLFFLAALGVRTVSIAAGSNNLAAGDVGVPIDPLVQAAKNQIDVEPVATYYPGAGQYWLAFRPLTIAATLLVGQFLLTSPVYPVEVEDAIENGTSAGYGRLVGAWSEDAIENDSYAVYGTNPQLLKRAWHEEDALSNDTNTGYGTLGGDIVIYGNAEDAIIGDTAVGYGTVVGKLIVYDNYEDALIGSTSAGYGTLEILS